MIKHTCRFMHTLAMVLQGVTLMCNFSKWGKHFSKLIAASKQSFTLDKDRTFTLFTASAMVTTVDPWVNKHRTD